MYEPSIVSEIYDSHNKNDHLEAYPVFNDKYIESFDDHSSQNSISLITPNIWDEPLGLEDLDLSDLEINGFRDKHVLSARQSIIFEEWQESVSQDSTETIPLVCEKDVLQAIKIEAHTRKEAKKSVIKKINRGYCSRMRRKPVPDNMKDQRYWSRRLKNNEAAKRSRDARRIKENLVGARALCLEKINEDLRLENSRLSAENSELKNRLSKYECVYSSHNMIPEKPFEDHKNIDSVNKRWSKRTLTQPSFLKSYDLY